MQGPTLIGLNQEEIRLAVDTWSQALLPAHLEAISLCWNEALTTAPIAGRVKLVAFLIQLHPHFPAWKGMSRCSALFRFSPRYQSFRSPRLSMCL